MRKLIVTLCCALPLWGMAQNPEIKSELSNVIPPSPTVAALMKFEEVPVNNYTGLPDISIPLFSCQTLVKQLPFNLSLNYHAGISANDISGEVGLGWSVIAGGSVSRTVRSLPDEILEFDGFNTYGKVGLYQTTILNHNNYYEAHHENFSQFFYDSPQIANQYYWENAERGKYDNEYDLWQFNFMGKSGKFIMKKNNNNVIEVVPVDDYRLKIINHYTTINNKPFIPNSFTIIDENGFRYEFNVYETTRNFSASKSIGLLSDSESFSPENEFRSAFHLTEVYDNNNNLILKFNYSNNSYFETSFNYSITNNEYNRAPISSGYDDLYFMSKYNCFNEFRPLKIINTNHCKIMVKKIESIVISNIAKIDYLYNTGRMDTNITQPENVVYLDRIKIFNFQNNDWNLLKSYDFNYGYSFKKDNRMILSEMIELNSLYENNQKYSFEYRSIDSNNQQIGKDYWGFLNLIPNNMGYDRDSYLETTPQFSTNDLLEKIKYPTGGCSIFDFESNQYSYIGNQQIENFDENPDNFEFNQTVYLTFSGINSLHPLNFSSLENQKVIFKPDIILNDDSTLNTEIYTLVKEINGQWVTVGTNVNCVSGQADCEIEYVLEKNVHYAIKRNSISLTPSTSTFEIDFFKKTANQKQYLYGGGNRIKQIGYFDIDVPKEVYRNMLGIQPSKEKKFTYYENENLNHSSGSLAYAKPVFSYLNQIKIATNCPEPPFLSGQAIDMTIHFKTTTSTNNLSAIKSQGSDIGYKSVKIYETGNGYTEFQYTSPYEFPEEILFYNVPPFLPSKNYDFKRGLLLNEKIYSEDSKLLVEKIYRYNFIENELKFGIRLNKTAGCGFDGSFFTSYIGYLSHLIHPQGPTGYTMDGFNYFSDYNLCGYPVDYITKYDLFQSYGWAKLESKETKNYFYDANNNQSEVVTRESFEYNPLNKMIAEHKVLNSINQETKTTYNYLTDPTALAQNRIAEIEEIQVEKDGAPISSSKIVYSNTFAGNANVHLPSVIQTAKGGLTLENKIRYNQYDTYGNPLEVQQENGMLISYIYGYHNSQVVAKIENIGYNSIPANLITAIQNATDAATYSENAVLSALDALRNHSVLANCMVTTVTHIPLVGVSTMTTPNGIRMQYHYDSMNRLEKVTDHYGNIVTENSYNYRP